MCHQHMELLEGGFLAFFSQLGMFLALIVEATNTSAFAVKFKTPGNMKSKTLHA